MRTRAHNTTLLAGPLPRWAALLLITAGLAGALLTGGCAEDFSAVLELTGQDVRVAVTADRQCGYYTAACRLGEARERPISADDPCQANYQDEFGDWLSCWDEIDGWFEEGALPEEVREAVGSVPVQHPKTKIQLSGEGQAGCSYPYIGEPALLAFGESACCAGGTWLCHCDRTAGLTKSHCVSGNCVAAGAEGARCEAKEGQICASEDKGKLLVDACEPGTVCVGDGCTKLGRCTQAAHFGLPETCTDAKVGCAHEPLAPELPEGILGPLCLPGVSIPLYLYCDACQDNRCHLSKKMKCDEMPASLASWIVRDL